MFGWRKRNAVLG